MNEMFIICDNTSSRIVLSSGSNATLNKGVTSHAGVRLIKGEIV